MFQKKHDLCSTPAPQIVTAQELITICRMLEGANLKETKMKFEIIRDYALKHEMETGRAYIALQAT